MTQHLLIVGSGPAAAGAALAATERPDVRVTVLDVGGQLEEHHAGSRARMATSEPPMWREDDRVTISQLPVDSNVKGLPEKRAFGSNFPFRDFGQRQGISALGGLNDAVVSGAYGGFSNVWGAQFMPFTEASFRRWPVAADVMYRHYAAILDAVPQAAEEDDLAELFPILGQSSPLPPVSPRTASVLRRYGRHRSRLRADGILVGRARLAMDAPACVRCGLCMTGCPYELIYSAAQTMDALRRRKAIDYRSGLLAVHVGEGDERVTLVARELRTGQLHEFHADRAILACGAIGTSRLILGSLGWYDTAVELSEAVQFMLPFLSRVGVADPRATADFTLNQFNIAFDLDGDGHDVSQLHFYTFNAAFEQALPLFLQTPWARRPRRELLRRLSVALGYLPSWGSPGFRIRVRRGQRGQLPPLEISGDQPAYLRNSMLRQTIRRILTAAPALDLWPVLAMLQMSAGGKSYHWGSTFPHAHRSRSRLSSDVLGRVGPWSRIHAADASVFPNVPATTFTLTIMANAHRIVTEALRESA